jgi:hypothetical protein
MGSDGIATITRELDTDSTIRLLLVDPATEQADTAVELATELLNRTKTSVRPRAELRARVLLACALQAASRPDDAATELAPAVVTCTERGLIRPLLDGGPRILDIVDALEDHLHTHSPPPGWSEAADAFLLRLRDRR